MYSMEDYPDMLPSVPSKQQPLQAPSGDQSVVRALARQTVAGSHRQTVERLHM